MTRTRIILTVVAVVAIALAGVIAFALRTPKSPFDGASSENLATVAGGAYAQRLGDCVACHTAPNGKPFAGGLKMMTPLGAIFSTNITPDPETGIGNYTLAEFDNAVRKGVAPDGHRLYPAMPYPSYAKMSDDDVRALYSYFMHTVQPVQQKNIDSTIPFPLGQRWPLALWNLVFASSGPYVPKPDQDELWNRGAYLVQGPGHCGSCHTPRGLAFNEKGLDDSSKSYLSGAHLDGWFASSLRGDVTDGLGRWSEAEIVEFLKLGRNRHASVYGSMLEVFNNSTQFMSDADLAAIAHYLKSLLASNPSTPAPAAPSQTTALLQRGDFSTPGSGLYIQHCSSCHGIDGQGHAGLLPPLAANPSIIGTDPSSLVNVILNGTPAPILKGVPGSYRMPSFRGLLSDQDVADLATFVRSNWGNAASPVAAKEAQDLRDSTTKADTRGISIPVPE